MGIRVRSEEMRPPQMSMRAKHQKIACSRPPQPPVRPRDWIRAAHPSRCRRQALGEQDIISSTQRTTQEARTTVVFCCRRGESRWMAC